MIAFALFILPSMAHADEWGDLCGRFVYDGDVPKIPPISIPEKYDSWNRKTVPDSSIIVNPTNRGIANVIVYLETQDDSELKIHPCYDASKTATKRLTLSQGQISPRVLLLRCSQPLVIYHCDKTVGYSASIRTIENAQFARFAVLGPKEGPYYFKKPEQVPVPVIDDIYPWMKSHVLIQAHPYMACTDRNGYFRIRNLPVGENTFRIWHERSGWLKGLELNAVVDTGTRYQIRIRRGTTMLPVMPVKFHQLE